MAQGKPNVLHAIKCPRCGTKYGPQEMGYYECTNCGFREAKECGLVRDCYEKIQGEVTAKEVAEYTGISEKVVTEVTKMLRLELKDLEDHVHKCNKCGTRIMYGRYCQDCKKDLLGGLRGTF